MIKQLDIKVVGQGLYAFTRQVQGLLAQAAHLADPGGFQEMDHADSQLETGTE